MTPRLRRVAGRDLIRDLRALGFDVVNVEGSHAKLRRFHGAERQTLTIPLHDPLAPGTTVAIYRQLRRYVSEEQGRPIFYK